jgi:hypothetical protein
MRAVVTKARWDLTSAAHYSVSRFIQGVFDYGAAVLGVGLAVQYPDAVGSFLQLRQSCEVRR